MSRLTGTYEHTLDAKGRLAMPARLREEIGDCFYLAMGTDACLTLYPLAVWDELCQQAEGLEEEEDIETMEVFFAQAYRCTVDAQNRIVIPPPLRAFAQLERDVVIVGANRVARVWNAARWAERVALHMTPQRMKSLARKVRL